MDQEILFDVIHSALRGKCDFFFRAGCLKKRKTSLYGVRKHQCVDILQYFISQYLINIQKQCIPFYFNFFYFERNN